MPGNSTNIFISYGRADARELAIRLRDNLQAVGYRVWLDLNELPGGANWSQDIEEAIEHCHLMIAIMSPHSYNSQWCRAEQLRAIRKGKRLIPLMAVIGAEPPLHLEHLNYLDFTDANRYDEMFRDLLSDITAGSAFRQMTVAAADGKSPFKKRRVQSRSGFQDEKRTAPAFRRYLKELRQEDWLGARFWWTYFVFYFTDIHQLVDILSAEELTSPFKQGLDFNTRFDKFVRLYFRPRTPDLFHAEGFRPASPTISAKYAPIPAYLLFDLEAVITQPETRFAEGDPDKIKKTYKTASYFRDMPFEQIYHDSWFMPDEREEIMRCREAQILIQDRIGLESLQVIWMRSPAEYETLHQVMPPDLWQKWNDKITARTDYHLFNNKRPYVQEAILEAHQVRLRFNPCQNPSDCASFHALAVIEYSDGQRVEWQDETFIPEEDLILKLSRSESYHVQLLFDGDVAYAGQYQPELQML
ncbi:MAG: DarT ssDNA thymidine ADP-ribosyltransferase family protein [Anaerolineae bacterium]|nr:DarT ssDNA thymidine ADP-ribosyltransferase family protein [Anaerolineae bacterium]MDQ7037217.1 DarT ssDNA thymidine ADP-ribosyltransferase family protein [Anaerolineae bacterium]